MMSPSWKVGVPASIGAPRSRTFGSSRQLTSAVGFVV
jgi:hypothetical protein